MKQYLVLLTRFALLLSAVWLLGCGVNQRIEMEYPPIGEFVTVESQQLHYLDSGNPDVDNDVPTLVLLHGASTSLLDFQQNLFSSLSPHYRVLAFDRPGLGYSQRASSWADPAEQGRLIAKALEQLGIDEAVWIGHSWAGSVVLAALLDHPEQVAGGVLLAGASHPWESGVSWHVALSTKPLIGPLFNNVIVPIAGPRSLAGAVASVFTPEKVPENYIEDTGVKLTIRPKTFSHNSKDIYCLSPWLQTQIPRYESLTQPLLLLTGTADTVVPSWNHAARLVEIAPNAKWTRLNGAGHALHHSRTEAVVSYIRQYLNEHFP